MKSILQAHRSGELEKIGEIIVVSNKFDAPGLNIAKKEFGTKTLTVLTDGDRHSFENNLIHDLQSNGISKDNSFICLAGFMRILSPLFINHYKNRIVNIHPSLLPSFKGLHAQKQALSAGVKITGCTVHLVDEGVDSGPIILQKCVPVLDTDTVEILSERILNEEHEIYVKSLKLLTSNRLIIKENRVFEI